MKFRISNDLVLGNDFVTSTQAIIAQKGKGKTYTASVEAEELLDAGQQIVVIDPTDAWFGLRSSPSGKSTGYPIAVFGGDHGDVQLETGGGAVLAEAVVRERFSAIICTETMTKGEELRFVGDFLETLYRKNREAMHLFIDEADIFCLDEETEILTIEGWKHQREINVGTVAVAFDLANGEYKYEAVTGVIRKQHDGPMVMLQNKNIDIRMTPEHRVVLRREQRAKGRRRLYDWTFVPAHDVPHHIHVPIGGAPPGAGLPISDDLLRLIGWIITDGYFAGSTRSRKSFGRYLGIEQSQATRKQGRSMVAELDALLGRLGCKGRYVRSLRKGGKIKSRSASVAYYLGLELSAKVLEWTGPEIHRISRELITGCSRAQLEVLMQGLLEGDGTFSKKVGEWVTLYAGLNSGLADDVQEIALRLGLSASKRFTPSNGQWTVQLSRRDHHHFRKPAASTYRGIVWCVTLPSGAFVARRNGRAFVTGNCPQQTFGVADGRTCGATDDIVRRGRKKGIGCTLISQRASAINKNVLSQADMLVALGCSHPLDLDAIEKWVRKNADPKRAQEMMQSLPSLPRGEAWVWNPSQGLFKRIAIRQRLTFDSGATPKAGEKRRDPKVLAPIDLARLGKSMADAAERQRQSDPKALRSKIAELVKERDQLSRAVNAAPAKTKVVEKPIVTDKQIARIEKLLARAEAVLEKHDAAVSRHHESYAAALEGYTKASKAVVSATQVAIDELRDKLRPVPGASAAQKIVYPPGGGIAARGHKRVDGANGWKAVNEAKADPSLQPAHLRILSAIAWWESLGVSAPDLGGVAFVAGTTTKSSAFNNNRSRLRAAGYINYPSSGSVELTDKGRELTPPPILPPTNEALHSAIFQKVTPANGRLLRALIESYPNELSLEEFASRAGTSTSSSAFNNNRSWLKARGLAEYPRSGFVRATQLLFPEAS